MDFGCKVTKKYPNYRIFDEIIGENGTILDLTQTSDKRILNKNTLRGGRRETVVWSE